MPAVKLAPTDGRLEKLDTQYSWTANLPEVSAPVPLSMRHVQLPQHVETIVQGNPHKGIGAFLERSSVAN